MSTNENDFTRKNLTTSASLLNEKQYNYQNLYDEKDFDDQFLEIASDSDEEDFESNSNQKGGAAAKNLKNGSLGNKAPQNNGFSLDNEEETEDAHNIVNEDIDESVREDIEDEYENENTAAENEREKEARCAYCGISNPAHIVKCNEKDCQRWFCDGRLDEFSASHIVFHLTKSKHKEIFLNENSPIGEMVLECYSCGCKNIFLLGFLESREGDTGIILCREPCLSQCKIVEDKFEKSRWVPLIKDKKLLEWIVPALGESDMKICNRVNIRSMSKMEEKWIKEKLQVSEEKPKFLGNWLKAVKLCYNDGQDYLETFEPLISAEEEYDRKLKEAQKKHNISVFFYKANKRFVARFNYPREDNEIKLVPGDELRIHDPANTYSLRGFIVKIEIDDEVHLELEKSDKKLESGIYTIEFVWKGTYFKRMLDGLYSLVNDESSLSSYLYYKILGHNLEEKKFNYNIPKDLSVKGLPEMNYFQTLGVKKALQTPLFLVQGPPGTGKTVTSAAIVYHMAHLKVGKVLVCAPSNIAADQLSEKISKTGLKVVRLCAKSRESISTRVEHLSLHNQIKSLYQNTKDSKRLVELMKMKEEGELKKDDYENYKKLKTKAENEVLNQAEVVVTTCIASFDKRLNNFRFPMVLVDEATQSCEGECLLPLLRGAKHVILVGDHCQLGPVVLCKNAAKAGLKMSLFERLIKLKIKPHMLQVQYRMHPMLSEFPSNTFYSGNLQNGVSAEERIHYSVNFNWPNPNKPMFFYHIAGTEEFSASGTSYLNRKEAEFIEKSVTALLKSSVKPDQIGIITPYEGQRSYIVTHMLKNGSVNQNLYKEIEVASVDSFQGREKDYIILSCVRSNDHNGIGFLNDPRRLNVALTRARYGIIIVGNANSLSKHLLWNNLLYHFKSNGLLVEGGLNSFKEYLLVLRNPVRFIPEKQCFETQLSTEDALANAELENENNEEEENKADKAEKSKTDEKYEEMLNDATVSRFSDFGYTNDKDSIEHHKKVKDCLKNKPIKLSNEISQNKYDMLIANFNMNTQMPNKFVSPNNTVVALNNMIQNNNFAFQNNPKMMNNPMLNNINMLNMPNMPMNPMFMSNMPTPMMNQFNPMNPVPPMNSQFNQNNMMNSKLYYNHSNFVFKDYYRNLNNEKKFVMQAEF